LSSRERLERTIEDLRKQLQESQERVLELEAEIQEQSVAWSDYARQRHLQLRASAELARKVQRQERELRLLTDENALLRRQAQSRNRDGSEAPDPGPLKLNNAGPPSPDRPAPSLPGPVRAPGPRSRGSAPKLPAPRRTR
jgi:hypothetical protein